MTYIVSSGALNSTHSLTHDDEDDDDVPGVLAGIVSRQLLLLGIGLHCRWQPNEQTLAGRELDFAPERPAIFPPYNRNAL